VNQIQQRVAQFISAFPPFDLLPEAALSDVAQSIDVVYAAANDYLFRENDVPLNHFFVVRKGSVRIISNNVLIDQCDEGDVFGVRVLLANDRYLADAEVEENAVLYCIPAERFKQIMTDNPQVANYFISGFASGKSLPQTPFRILSSAPAPSTFMSGVQVINGNCDVVHCAPSTTIKAAALAMMEKGVGSIVIVDKQGCPLGIITDKDLRNKVATGLVSIDEPASKIMSAPVITVLNQLSQTDYLVEMLAHRVHHLCITNDGTASSPITGMITEHDLLLQQGNNPALILKEVDRAQSIDRLIALRKQVSLLLRKHIDENMPVEVTMRLATAITERITQKVIEMAMDDIGQAPVSFCWLALGSLGRGEQILQTDQDHALVYQEGDHQDYFLRLAKEVSSLLERLGHPKDPADVSAENPKWCLTLNAWKAQFTKWIETPDPDSILHTTIFLDFRPVYGNRDLANELRQHIFNVQTKAEWFTTLLARDALQTPSPLSFFRNLVVERSGEYKDRFDIKLRVLLPLVDCARVMAIDQKIDAVHTPTRYMLLAQRMPNRATLMESAAEATNFIIRLKAESGFSNNDGGRYIEPKHLNKLNRQMLRTIFSTLDDLQQMVKSHFQTDRL
jgi:CBS domain-containing protein